MHSKKYILTLALSITTTISASIPREEVTTQISPLVAASQVSENIEDEIATDIQEENIALESEKTDLQELADNETAPQSELQVEVAAEIAQDASSEENAPQCLTFVTEVSFEQAQDILGDNVDLFEGFEFEYEGKKYIIKTMTALEQNIENIFEEESQK